MIYDFNGKSPDIDKTSYISPSVDVIGDVSIGEDSSIWFGSVVRGDMHYVKIGSRTNIQDNSTVHVTTDLYPTIIGDEVTIGHNVIVHGCQIEDRCLIGMGSIILDNAVINKMAFIAAGAVVTPGSEVKKNELWAGNPAKFLRMTNENEKKLLIPSDDESKAFANKPFLEA